MNTIFDKLYSGKSLTETESENIFTDIFAGKISNIKLASLLTALKIKGESESEVAGAALAMLKAAKKISHPNKKISEIVGTGGDGFKTFNISTISAIILASLGICIAKHGNKAVSSNTGSSDLLLELGYNINTSSELSLKLLNKENFAFIFAQKYHSAMKYAAEVRADLKIRTIFNLLGPLTNPINPDIELLGVYDKSLINMMASILHRTGVKRAFCVNGNGLDEIACFGQTYVAHLKEDGEIENMYLDKHTFGITKDFNMQDIQGQDTKENAKIAIRILQGHGSDAQNSIIAANMSALLFLNDRVDNLKDGFDLAIEAIKGGQGYDKLQRICALSHEE